MRRKNDDWRLSRRVGIYGGLPVYRLLGDGWYWVDTLVAELVKMASGKLISNVSCACERMHEQWSHG